jgi:transporter family-2 protein
MEQLLIPIAFLAGALLPLQAGANAQLSKATGSAFAATTLQLSVGAVSLALVALFTASLIPLPALGRIPWWHLAGGTASAFYVVSTILLFPRLGAVVTVGLFIVGQILASLALDSFGLLGVAVQPPDHGSIAGAIAMLAGAAMIIFDQKDAARQLNAGRLGWIALALAAGVVLPVQGGVNALLRNDIGEPAVVGAISFVVATLSMAAVLAVAVGVLDAPKPRLAGVTAMPWWGWLGGFAGAAYVTTVFTAIPVIGAAAAIGLTIAGQQIVSIFVDRYGWFRLPVRPVSGTRLLGVIILLTGVTLIKAV